jgi:dolichol-phosphate mannosyltransferase
LPWQQINLTGASFLAGNISGLGDIRLAVVCPMANEHQTAVRFVNSVLAQCQGLKQVTFFAVLDHISKDQTVGVLNELAGREPRLRVIWAPENKCVVDAYVRGYREALKTDCDWILEIDAGFSHDPAEIPRFFEKMLAGYDCVFGSRFCKGGTMRESSLRRRIISRGGSILVNILLGSKLKDMTSGFEMFTRPALEMVLAKGIKSRAHFFQTEIKLHCRGLRMAEVPISYRAPSSGVGGAVLTDAFGNLFRLVWLRVSGRL